MGDASFMTCYRNTGLGKTGDSTQRCQTARRSSLFQLRADLSVLVRVAVHVDVQLTGLVGRELLVSFASFGTDHSFAPVAVSGTATGPF